MATQTVSLEAGSMPVTMAVDGFDAALDSTPVTESGPAENKNTVKRLRDLKTSARDQLMIDPRIIVVDDHFNPRDYTLPENHAHLDELKRSIRENGVLVPLLVRFDPARKAAVLCDGECRLRAVLELIAEGVEILTVPTVQVSGGNESDRLLIAITANTGKPLSKWELGNAFQRLYRFGWDEPKIATKTGYAERFIREAMELADAPDEVKQLLSSQAVTPSLALSELRANGAAAVETLKAAAVAAQSTGQKTAKRAKAKNLPPAKPRTENEPAPVEVQTAPAAQPVNGKAKHAPKAQIAMCPEVMHAMVELMADVALNELNDPKIKRVHVDKDLLLKLASYMVTTDGEVEAANSVDVKF